MKIICSLLILLFLCVFAPPQSIDQKPYLVVQTGHSGLIAAIAFTSDSKLVASGSDDNTIKIWDVATGAQLRTLTGHTKGVNAVTFSPDSRLLASGSNDDTARIWDVSTGKLLHTLTKHSMPVKSVAINRDGTVLATSSIDKLIVLWDLQSGKEIRTLVGHGGNVSSVAFGPDGKTLASSSWDKTVKLWNTSTGEVLQTLPADVALMSVAFSPNGRMVAGAGSFSVIKLWDAASGQELHTMRAGAEWVYPIAFSPDSKFLASGSNSTDGRTVKLWDVSTGREAEAFKSFMHQPRVFSMAFSPDGKTLAVGGDENSVSLVDTAQAAERLTLKGHSDAVNSIAFSPDGNTLAVAGRGAEIKLWDLQSQRSLKSLAGHSGQVTMVAFSPDSSMLASSSYDKTVRIWELSSGRSKMLNAHSSLVNCVAFSPEGHLLASGGDDSTIKIWNLETGALLRTLAGHLDGVRMIAFSPDGKILASASADTTIKLWEVANGRELNTWNGHSNWVQSVAFSPDGQTLASASVDTNVKLWSVNTGKEIRTLEGHSAVVQAVAFSPDGRRLASASWDRTIKIWDVASGSEIQTLKGHADQVVSVAFYRGGKILASGSLDAQTTLWDTASGANLASLIALDEKDWAVVAPDGRFDASNEGMKLMHYVHDNQPIPLESFFEQFNEPRLLSRVISGAAARAKPPAVDISRAVKRPPPLVKIISPKNGDSFNNDSVRIVLEAIDQGGGIDEISLYQNGRAVEGNPRQLVQTESSQRAFDVTLLPGVNTFRATAFNKDRTEQTSYPAEIKIELRAAEATADLYILAVGLNEYKNTRYNLNYGAPDAQAFADALEQRAKTIFRRINKQVILSPPASSSPITPTRDSIATAFTKITMEARPQDVFIFYYAGHGVMSDGDNGTPQQFYLVPYDVTKLYGDDEGLASKGLSSNQLKELCLKVKAQKQLIILDACQSGGAIDSLSRGVAEEKAIAQLNRSTGFAVLASTNSEQVAREFAKLGHGVFTYALLKGLAGEADRSNPPSGKITVHQLVAYLDDTVPELTLQYVGTRQFPTNYARGQDFPLGVK